MMQNKNDATKERAKTPFFILFFKIPSLLM